MSEGCCDRARRSHTAHRPAQPDTSSCCLGVRLGMVRQQKVCFSCTACGVYSTQREVLSDCTVSGLTCGLLRGDVFPLSPGGLLWGVCCLVGGRQASRRAAAHLSLVALPYRFLLQEYIAATETKLAPQAPTVANANQFHPSLLFDPAALT